MAQRATSVRPLAAPSSAGPRVRRNGPQRMRILGTLPWAPSIINAPCNVRTTHPRPHGSFDRSSGADRRCRRRLQRAAHVRSGPDRNAILEHGAHVRLERQATACTANVSTRMGSFATAGATVRCERSGGSTMSSWGRTAATAQVGSRRRLTDDADWSRHLARTNDGAEANYEWAGLRVCVCAQAALGGCPAAGSCAGPGHLKI